MALSTTKFWQDTLANNNFTSNDAQYNARKGFLLLWGAATMVIPIFSIYDIIHNATSDSQGQALEMVTVLLMVIFVLSAVSNIVLMFVANTQSLSMMLAQRWNPVSNVSSYFITALCYFCCAWVGAIYVMRHMHGKEDPQWKIVCSMLCFVFISASQLFPMPKESTPAQLGLGQNVSEVAYAGVRTNSVPSSVMPALLPCFVQYQELWFLFHLGLVLTGTFLAYFVMGNFLNNFTAYYSDNLALSMAMIVIACVGELIALVCAVITFTNTVAPAENDPWKNVLLGMESFFLYCTIIGVVLAVMAESDVFRNYEN